LAHLSAYDYGLKLGKNFSPPGNGEKRTRGKISFKSFHPSAVEKKLAQFADSPAAGGMAPF
jgi:hypothetical protein